MKKNLIAALFTRTDSSRSAAKTAPKFSTLRAEPLESRELLSVAPGTELLAGAGYVSSIEEISLREALDLSNVELDGDGDANAGLAYDDATTLLLRADGTLLDESGIAPTNSPSVTYVDGLFGQAVEPGDTAIMFNASDVVNASEGTIEFWYKPNYDRAGDYAGQTWRFVEIGNPYQILISVDGANNFRTIFWGDNLATDDVVETLYENGNGLSAGTWKADEWIHIAATWNQDGDLAAYINGAQVGSKQGVLRLGEFPENAKLKIGGFANGAIDEFRISNRARTAQEIYDDYRLAPSQTYVVTTAADVVDANDDVLSLREAIANAAPFSTITFAPELAGTTITLGSQISVDKSITVDASALWDATNDAPGLTLSGNDATRLFEVAAGTEADPVAFKGLTFADGYDSDVGGAIKVSSGYMTVEDSVFSENSANRYGGAVFVANGATATFTDATFDGNVSVTETGGAINTDGAIEVADCLFTGNQATASFGGGAIQGWIGSSITISGSTFQGNSGYNAGAIYANNLLTITDSTFTENTSTFRGGAVSVFKGNNDEPATIDNCVFTENAGGYGGGLFAMNRAVVTTNSTFTSNSATQRGGAAWVENATGSLTFNNVVFNDNTSANDGGAICADANASLVVADSEFNRNSANGGGAIRIGGADASLTLTNSDFTENAAQDGEGGALAVYDGTATVTGGTFASNTATGHGGAARFNNASFSFTQTSFTGNSAGNQGGAFKTDGGSTISIDGCNFVENTAPGDGGAIQIWDAPTVTITDSAFTENESSASGGAAYLRATEIDATDLTFTGNAARNHGGGLYISEGSSSTIANSEFTQNTVSGANDAFGGAIYARGTFNATECVFTENAVEGQYSVWGGAVFIHEDATATVSACEFESNTAKHVQESWNVRGGAICTRGITTVEDSTFTNNSLDGLYSYGGAIDNYDGTLEVKDSVFTGNTTGTRSGAGGAIFSRFGSLSILRNDFTSNSSLGDGGAVRVERAESQAEISFTSINCNFYNNASSDKGGAISTQNLESLVEGGEFSGNSARHGGAILSYSPLTINDSTFTGNSATVDGGAIYADGNVVADNATFTENHADVYGGAIRFWYRDTNSNGTFTNSTFTNNTANDYGGALKADGGAISITGCDFTENTSPSYGGAAQFYQPTSLTISDSTFTRNQSTNSDGGAVWLEGDGWTIEDSTFDSNTAVGSGGGVFANAGSGTITGGTFQGNSANTGGAVNINGTATVTSSTFTGNQASYQGGAANVSSGGTLVVASSVLEDNYAATYGGAINSDGAITINGSSFTGNRSDGRSGALDVGTSGSATILNSVFSGNHAQGNGGAAYLNGPATIDGVQFLNNVSDSYSGAVHAAKTATITNSTFDGNTAKQSGGALSLGAADSLVDNCAFTNNTSTNRSSGAVDFNVDGSATIRNSVFTNNRTLLSDHDAGAIGVFRGTLNLENSMVCGNSSAGYGGGVGMPWGGTTLNAINVTIANNSAAEGGNDLYLVDSGATANLYNSIVLQTSGEESVLNNGVLNGYNTLSNVATWNAGSANFQYSPGLSVFAAPTNGDYTLARNSVAINVGNATYLPEGLTTDLAGAARVALGEVDLGAYEYNGETWKLAPPFFMTLEPGADSITASWNPVVGANRYALAYAREGEETFTTVNAGANTTLTISGLDLDAVYKLKIRAISWNETPESSTWSEIVSVRTNPETPSLVVTTLDDVVDAYDHEISLREAVEIYAQNGDTITFDPSLAGGTVTLGGAPIEVDKPTTIDASALWDSENDAPGLTVDANQNSRIFSVRTNDRENAFSIVALALVNGNVGDYGGAVDSNYSLVVARDVVVENCSSGLNSGAFNVNYSTFEIVDSAFVGNSAQNLGGAIAIGSGSQATISGSRFEGNSVAGSGGVFYVLGGSSLTVTGSSFTGNEANNGGAIYADGAITLGDSTFESNVARQRGGGLYAFNCNVAVSNSEFLNNESNGTGGGAYICCGNAVFTDVEFVGNVVVGEGIDGQSDQATGGGVFLGDYYGAGSVGTFVNCEFTDNSSKHHGGAIENFRSSVTISGGEFSGNSSEKGGAISAAGEGATLTIENAEISGNTATTSGGGVYFAENAATLEITGSTISNNSANNGGGVYAHANGGTANLTNCTISGNSANIGGGVWSAGGGTKSLTNCEISGNTAEYQGGAIMSSSADLSLTNCSVINNAVTNGTEGAICVLGVGAVLNATNCLVAGNSVVNGYGGAMLIKAEANLYNCTVVGNTANYGGGVALDVNGVFNSYNSIIVGNNATTSGDDVYTLSSSPAANANNTLSSFTNWTSGANNIAYDALQPLFTDAANGDYTLATNPQAINKGDNQHVAMEVDLAGNPRVFYGTVDLGAYEYQKNLLATPANPRETATSTSITVAWDADPDASGYRLAWKNANDSEYVYVAFDAATNSYALPDVETGATYEWSVQALGDGVDYVDSYFTATRSVKAPVKLATPAVGCEIKETSIVVSWRAVGNASSYLVTYEQSGGSTKTASVTAYPPYNFQTQSYTISNVEPNTIYSFKVVAIGDGVNYENSDDSSAISATVRENPETPSTIVTTADDVYDVFDGVISLREAIEYAESGTTITFADSLQGGTIAIDQTLGQLEVAKSVTIDATNLWDATNSAPGLTIDGQHASRIMYLKQFFEIEIDGIALVNGGFLEGYESSGGAICNHGATLTLNNCVLSGNKASNGGGLWATLTHTTTFNNCVLTNNTATAYGGAVAKQYGTLTFNNCEIRDNEARYWGGGTWTQFGDSDTTFTNCLVAGNIGDTCGGLYFYQENATLYNCTIVDNTANSNGGGVYVYGYSQCEVASYNTIIAGNTGATYSPDVYVRGSQVSVNAYNTLSSFTEWTSGENNIAFDASQPLFTGAANGDYTLADASQAINKGDNQHVSAIADLAGNPRIFDGTVDLGAYEYQRLPLATPASARETAKTETTVTVAWDAVPDASGYRLAWKNSTDSAYAYVALDAATTSYKLTGLNSDATYDWKVQTIGDGVDYVDSAYTASRTVSPRQKLDSPTVVSYDSDRTSITFSWAAVPNASRYYVSYRLASETDWSNNVNVGTNLSYTVSGLETNAEYDLRVKAIGDGFDYATSDYATITVTARDPETASTVVTTNLDVVDKYDDLISLREALAYAESGATITFDDSLQGKTIALELGQLEVTESVTIDASNLWDVTNSAPGLTVSGQGTVEPALYVDGGDAEINGITFTNVINVASGKVSLTSCDINANVLGYGFHVTAGEVSLLSCNVTGVKVMGGEVSLTSCQITNNQSGVHVAGGEVSVTNCNMTGNSLSGVYITGGKVSLTNCISAGNGGAGVYVSDGEVKLTNCDIANNSNIGVEVRGVGDVSLTNCNIVNNAIQGVYVLRDAVLTATNSLIARNSARYGAGLELYGKATLYNCTIVDNTASRKGGGIDIDGSAILTMYNTIITGNNAEDSSSADVSIYSSTAVANAYNTLSSFADWTSGENNFTYDASQPLFADAADGDYTLADNSQAINQGDNQYVSTTVDLAGNSRIVGGTVDLGAFEHAETPSTVVTTNLDVVDYYDGEISLREALDYAESGDTITFDDSLQGKTIALELGQLTVTKSVAIDASNLWDAENQAPGLTIDGQGATGIMFVFGYPNVEINGITMTDGSLTKGRGGAIHLFGATLSLVSCKVTNNTAGYGGAICASVSSVITATNCLFSGNSAKDGGAFELSGKANLYNCTLVGNTANGYGGGVDLDEYAVLNAYNTIIAGNNASSSGNDFYFYSSNAVGNAYNTLSSFTDWTSGENNYVYDASQPLFTDAANDDYTLADNSQAIDKGDNQYVEASVDLEGNVRIFGDAVDLGAYEYHKVKLETPVVSVADATKTTLTVSWNAVPNADRYSLFYRLAGETDWTNVNVGTDLSYKIRGLEPNTEYDLRLKAIGDDVNYKSAYSEVVRAATISTLITLATPVLSVADATKTTLTVSWDAVPNADRYSVSYKLPSETNWTNANAGTNLSYTIRGLEPNTDYDVRVKAIGDGVDYKSVYSAILPAKTGTAIITLEKPVVSVEGRTGTTITVGWSFVPNAERYSFSYKPADETTWKNVNVGTNTSYTVTGLDLNSEYDVRVKAIGDGVDYKSVYSAVVRAETDATITPLAAPVVSVSGRTGTTITLKWVADGYAERYSLAYKPANETTWTNVNVGTNTGYTIAGLAKNTEYDVRVAAIGDGAIYESADSEILRAATNATITPLAKPVVTVADQTATTITVGWSAVPYADRYSLSYRRAGESSWKNVNVGTNLEYTITALDSNTDYNVRLKAIGDGVNYKSVYSAIVGARTTSTSDALLDLDGELFDELDEDDFDLLAREVAGRR